MVRAGCNFNRTVETELQLQIFTNNVVSCKQMLHYKDLQCRRGNFWDRLWFSNRGQMVPSFVPLIFLNHLWARHCSTYLGYSSEQSRWSVCGRLFVKTPQLFPSVCALFCIVTFSFYKGLEGFSLLESELALWLALTNRTGQTDVTMQLMRLCTLPHAPSESCTTTCKQAHLLETKRRVILAKAIMDEPDLKWLRSWLQMQEWAQLTPEKAPTFVYDQFVKV